MWYMMEIYICSTWMNVKIGMRFGILHTLENKAFAVLLNMFVFLYRRRCQ